MPSDLSIHSRSSGLVDVLDRVLDKGLVVAGDIKISLAEVELLTIRIRLLICSLDKAQEIGLDWWRHDRSLSPGVSPALADRELRQQLRALEQKVEALAAAAGALPAPVRRRARRAGQAAARRAK
ncbi:MAG TPA: gas vesicle protein [Vicinamibacterales bacterium]|nr:gas vesicle protein [Vicinamibacterales bacterium]